MMSGIGVRACVGRRGTRTAPGPSARRSLSILALLLLSLGALAIPLSPAVFASAEVSISTNSTLYTGSQTITVTGTVSPAPGNETSAFVQVTNPSGTVVRVDSVPVDPTTGAFSDGFTAGGTNWLLGTYTVKAT